MIQAASHVNSAMDESGVVDQSMASLDNDTSDIVERVPNTNASMSKDQSNIDMSMASLNDSLTEMNRVQEEANDEDDEAE